MYQSKLAKPEVKPHFYWHRTNKMWVYTGVNTNKSIIEMGRCIQVCEYLDRIYNPLRANK